MALLAALLGLSACGGGATFGQLPEWAGGLPAGAPKAPAETMPYPNVYEQRPVRDTKPLTDEQQKRLESELSNLRDAQNKRAIPPPPDLKAAADAKGATKIADKPAAKPRPKKVAEKAKPKAAEKKADDSVVPAQKAPSDLKPMN